MAEQSWVGLSILHGALEVACHAKSFAAPKVAVATLDQTALCNAWAVNGAGLKSFAWDASLMQDHSADSLDSQLWGQLGAQVPTTILPAGNAEGCTAYLMSALQLGYTPIDAALGETAMASLSGSGSGACARGMLMHSAGVARTATGTGTPFQLGAVSANQRAWAALHVTSASGTTPTIVVKLQSSASSGGTYTDRVTFSTASITGSEWSSALGAITHTWWRATWTITGTTPSFMFGVSAGIS